MKGSTITISNFGSEGGRWATPIINAPEACILGLARITQEPVVKEGSLAIGTTLNLSWCFDHRLIDGDLAAEFSRTFKTLLENPAQIC
jgi:pyruvate dehydrogenase E2 component (dihydrolipoamide acetyltransferase)/2-oxoisovalerate dehydrogenase E2 component (dihydrolipoyl transacylase)